MDTDVRPEGAPVRRVFPSWSIAIPRTFADTFLPEEGYWHAWDEARSISLSSFEVTDHDDRLVGAKELIAQGFSWPEGTPVVGAPPGTTGWAVAEDAIQPARASRMLTGYLVADGRVLAATITSDDIDWARQTWQSIRFHPAQANGSP